MIISREKVTKILLLIFIMVFSFCVLANKVPESEWVKNTKGSLEESRETIMEFSGATIATSLALSALPDDFASPLANTLTDMNQYFVFIFAVLFVEEIIVVEGIEIAFSYIIPLACLLYGLSILFDKELLKNFALKTVILGLAVVLVIPFSTHFAEAVCDDYLAYVDETIAEADAGATKVNDIMLTSNEDATIFEKLSDAFATAIQDVTMLLEYFNNVIKRCVNSIAIMLVTTFVLPMLVLLFFRWLLNELFSLNLNVIPLKISELCLKSKSENERVLVDKEDE